jgi:hypothetical protein
MACQIAQARIQFVFDASDTPLLPLPVCPTTTVCFLLFFLFIFFIHSQMRLCQASHLAPPHSVPPPRLLHAPSSVSFHGSKTVPNAALQGLPCPVVGIQGGETSPSAVSTASTTPSTTSITSAISPPPIARAETTTRHDSQRCRHCLRQFRGRREGGEGPDDSSQGRGGKEKVPTAVLRAEEARRGLLLLMRASLSLLLAFGA